MEATFKDFILEVVEENGWSKDFGLEGENAKRFYAREQVEREKMEIVKNMLSKGYPVDDISEITGLSKSIISQLQAEMSNVVSV